MVTRRGLAVLCILAEAFAFTYLLYLMFATPALQAFPQGVRQFDFVFIWLFPFIMLSFGYIGLTSGDWNVDSAREKLGWGIAIATFGCVLLAIMGGWSDLSRAR